MRRDPLCSALILIASAADSPGQPVDYVCHPCAVVGLRNETDRTVTYTGRWGGGEGRPVTLRPGASHDHSGRDSAEKPGHSPAFHVRFASPRTVSGGVVETLMESCTLERSQAVTADDQSARKSFFRWKGGRVDLIDPRG